MSEVILYKATNLLNHKGYIGFTSRGLETRQKEHYADAKRGSDLYFHRALRKYRKKDWSWEVLCSCSSIKEAGQRESQLILEHKTFADIGGYNATTGGQGAWNHTKDSKRRIGEAARGRVAWNKGKNLTPQHVSAISTAKRGNPKSEEHKKALSMSRIGISFTEEHRARLSKANKGKPWSDARRKAQEQRTK